MPHFFLTAARALNTSGHVRVIFAEGPALSFLLKFPGTIPDGNPKEVKDRTCQALALALSLELAGCVGVGLQQKEITVAILAQGTSRAVAVTHAIFFAVASCHTCLVAGPT